MGGRRRQWGAAGRRPFIRGWHTAPARRGTGTEDVGRLPIFRHGGTDGRHHGVPGRIQRPDEAVGADISSSGRSRTGSSGRCPGLPRRRRRRSPGPGNFFRSLIPTPLETEGFSDTFCAPRNPYSRHSPCVKRFWAEPAIFSKISKISDTAQIHAIMSLLA